MNAQVHQSTYDPQSVSRATQAQRNRMDPWVVEELRSQDPQHPLSELTKEIQSYGNLPKGWYNGAGKAPRKLTLRKSLFFLYTARSLPQNLCVAPTPDGDIHFEFQENGWDFSIEFLDSGDVDMCGIDLSSNHETETSLKKPDSQLLMHSVEKIRSSPLRFNSR